VYQYGDEMGEEEEDTDCFRRSGSIGEIEGERVE